MTCFLIEKMKLWLKLKFWYTHIHQGKLDLMPLQ